MYIQRLLQTFLFRCTLRIEQYLCVPCAIWCCLLPFQQWACQAAIEIKDSAVCRITKKAFQFRPLASEAQVCARFNPYGIRGGLSDTETGSSPSFSVFPRNITPLELFTKQNLAEERW
jgi:hypothetical protein